MAYLLANNTIISEAEANLSSFVLEASFVTKHSVWFGFGGIPLLKENLSVIEEEFKALGHHLPPLFKNHRELFRLTKRVLNKNRFYRTGLISFHFYFSAEKVDFLVTAKAFSSFDFQLNEQGLFISASKKIQFSQISESSFARAIFWEQVAAQNTNRKHTLAIILNENQIVCEGVASNVFMVKENVLFTPSINSGCYADVLRSEIIRLAKEINMKVIESEDIEIKHIRQMNEVFFASEAQGIQWILGFENRRYVHEYTDRIYSGLNNFLEKKVEIQK